MNMMRSYAGIGILIVFLIAVAGGMWWWFQAPKNDQHNSPSAQYYKDLEQRYAEDTYGGSTPEETLNLFIAALEAGNIDLASKYFVVEKQEEEKNNLSSATENQNLIEIVKRFRSLNLSSSDENSAFFTSANKDNILEYQIVLRKIQNGTWKISSL